ncbi:MAG: hypothetical protein ACOX0Q_05525 [Syntrophomonadaceae bacterium]
MDLLLKILDPLLGMIILAIIFGVGSWLIERAKWMMKESQPQWVRCVVPVLIVILILWFLSTWWGLLNLGFAMLLFSFFLMTPKGYGRWSGGFSEDVNQFWWFCVLREFIINYFFKVDGLKEMEKQQRPSGRVLT